LVRRSLVSLSVAELVTQRSMLTIVIAACTSARAVFDKADDAIDPQFREELDRMIERSTSELEKLNAAIGQAAGG
jgi:Ran GTPase-activating protein (RanGAP) involved in mRNA processing and transport